MGAAFSAATDPGPKEYAIFFVLHPDSIIIPVMALTVLLYASLSLLLTDLLASPIHRASRYLQTQFRRMFLPSRTPLVAMDSPEMDDRCQDRWHIARFIYAMFALVAGFTIGEMGIYHLTNVAGCSAILTLSMIFGFAARFLVLIKGGLELHWRGIGRAETVLLIAFLLLAVGTSLLCITFTSTGTLTQIFRKILPNMAVCPPSTSVVGLLPPLAFLVPSIYLSIRHFMVIRYSAASKGQSTPQRQEEQSTSRKLSEHEIKRAGFMCLIMVETVLWIVMTIAQEAGVGSMQALWIPWVLGAVVIIYTLQSLKSLRHPDESDDTSRRPVSIVTVSEEKPWTRSQTSTEVDRMFNTPPMTDRSRSNGVSRTSIDSGQFSIVNAGTSAILPPMPVQIARPEVITETSERTSLIDPGSLAGTRRRSAIDRPSSLNRRSPGTPTSTSDYMVRPTIKISDIPPRIPSLQVGSNYQSLEDGEGDGDVSSATSESFAGLRPSTRASTRASSILVRKSWSDAGRATPLEKGSRSADTASINLSLLPPQPEVSTQSGSPTGSDWTTAQPQFPSIHSSSFESGTFGVRTVPPSPNLEHQKVMMPPPAFKMPRDRRQSSRSSGSKSSSLSTHRPQSKPHGPRRAPGLPATPRPSSVESDDSFLNLDT